MTREEAISVLNGLHIPCAVTVDGYSCERNKAIDMAIEALSANAELEAENIFLKGMIKFYKGEAE